MAVRTAVGIVRIALAVLCAIALIARFIWGLGSATFLPENFFAYLTVQSSIVFMVVTAYSGVDALRRTRDAAWVTTLRAVVLSCTVTAGIVFALLVAQAGQRGVKIDVPWSDHILHFWLPAFALLDWLLAPDRGRAKWRSVAIVVGYAVVWGLVTMARGTIVGWYPYFFLDPAQVDGPGEFLLLSALALGVFASVTAIIVAMSRHGNPISAVNDT